MFWRFRTAPRRRAGDARGFTIGAAVAVLLLGVGTSQASHLFSDTAGHTTLERIITGPNPDAGYADLHSETVSRSYVVRDGASESNPSFPNALAGREQRRRSLLYAGQLTDFQLADEESPARVEFTDPDPSGTAAAAWRPQEALQPFIIDYSIRQMNLFAGASPVTQGDGTRAPMDLALMTGDQADNMQRNETLWTRDLLEGENVAPNSGSTNPSDYDPVQHPSCAGYPPSNEHRQEALRYTGVQDYDDYDEGSPPLFYDPDDVRGFWATMGFPTYTGLMDRAQLPFQPAGLDVPSYVTNGNHDGLVQGNEDANQAFEDIATSCLKALASTIDPAQFPNSDGPDPTPLLAPSEFMLVPPDPLRRFVDKRQIKQIYGENGVDDAHGYDFVDPAEDAASNGSASYYAWDPPQAPGLRFISIDTLSEGGVVGVSSSGNIDDPQFQWLKRELDRATARDQLIVLFGHHPVRSLTAEVADEAAGPCTPPDRQWGDTPEHNHNPGCDQDSRPSAPIHLGNDSSTSQSFVELLGNYSHVIAYVAGHTHDNKVLSCGLSGGCSGGGNWWEITTSATADWPVQHRLVELMDNRDGTLSIFGTVLDHAANATAPAPGSAQAFDEAQLASIGRTLAYNDPQAGPPSGQGTAADQDVELLIPDPRAPYEHPASAGSLSASLVPAYRQCGAGANTPNAKHAPPLSVDSCPPSTLGSAHAGAQSTGVASIAAVAGDPTTTTDEADFSIDATITDVRAGSSSGPDYNPSAGGPDLTILTRLRITDLANGGSGTDAGTTTDNDFAVPASCVPTGGTGGSDCSVQTTADAVVPGMIGEGRQSILQAFRIRVNDSGANGVRGDGDDDLFEQQGVFIP